MCVWHYTVSQLRENPPKQTNQVIGEWNPFSFHYFAYQQIFVIFYEHFLRLQQYLINFLLMHIPFLLIYPLSE